MHQLFSKKEDDDSACRYHNMACIAWVKIMGVLSVCLQWEEEGGVSNAQTKSGAVTYLGFYLFIL